MTATLPAPALTIKSAIALVKQGVATRLAKFASYDAAYPSRTTRTSSWIGTNQNATPAAIQRFGMQFTAEDVFKNSSLGAAYILQRINYCSSMLTYVPATSDAKLNALIREYLHGYDGFGGVFATMGVACSMRDAFSRTADLETPIRGDAGLIWYSDDDGGLRLMEFSADQLGEPFNFVPPRSTALQMVNGELRECAGNSLVYYAGRYFKGCDCIAYKIYERTNSWYGSPRIYAASDVIYFNDPASFRGVRGVTKFATALQHMEKGEALFQTGMDAALRQSKTAIAVMNGQGAPDPLSYQSIQNLDGTITYQERIPGGPLTEYFYTGDDYKFMSPDSPGPELIQGVETSDERVALALGVNYAFLISASKVGGAPSRLEVNKANKEMLRIQNTIHRPRLAVIAYRTIMNAVDRGLLPAHPEILQGRWMLPISATVDAFYDATENIKMLRSGLESAQDIIAETNRDWQDVIRKSQQWAEACAKAVEDGNKQLVSEGYRPTITIADIAQVSENPQQAAAGEAITQGKPASGDDNPQNKAALSAFIGPLRHQVATLGDWDESKHKRGQPGNAGEFGPGGGSDDKPATKENPHEFQDSDGHKTTVSQNFKTVTVGPEGNQKTVPLGTKIEPLTKVFVDALKKSGKNPDEFMLMRGDVSDYRSVAVSLVRKAAVPTLEKALEKRKEGVPKWKNNGKAEFAGFTQEGVGENGSKLAGEAMVGQTPDGKWISGAKMLGRRGIEKGYYSNKENSQKFDTRDEAESESKRLAREIGEESHALNTHLHSDAKYGQPGFGQPAPSKGVFQWHSGDDNPRNKAALSALARTK